MKDVYIGKGKLAGKGVYAARDFNAGEMVMAYDLRPITQAEYSDLPKNEKIFTHSFWGQIYLFPEPSRFTNHSANPNTVSDLKKMCDFAIRPIKKGEMITTNATKEVHNEVKTFVESREKSIISEFTWIKDGYRNAVVSYKVDDIEKKLVLTRMGNWHVIDEQVIKT